MIDEEKATTQSTCPICRSAIGLYARGTDQMGAIRIKNLGFGGSVLHRMVVHRCTVCGFLAVRLMT